MASVSSIGNVSRNIIAPQGSVSRTTKKALSPIASQNKQDTVVISEAAKQMRKGNSNDLGSLGKGQASSSNTEFAKSVYGIK
jgi:hypothetical protein